MADEQITDFEIGDVENFSSSKDQQFSHSMLVMMNMKRASENGSKEMKPGWFNVRTDSQGNTIKTYIDDTRKSFIESVKSCCMIMACDFDKEAEDYIDECLEEINKYKRKLIRTEQESWNKLTPSAKLQATKFYGGSFIPGFLNHPALKEELIWFQIEMYRSIFAELSRLTKRLDYYQHQAFEA